MKKPFESHEISGQISEVFLMYIFVHNVNLLVVPRKAFRKYTSKPTRDRLYAGGRKIGGLPLIR
jgi:hypothetical protein